MNQHQQHREALFNERDVPESRGQKSDEPNSSNIRNRKLIQAHSEMANELQRMRATASVIDDSSKTIKSIDSRYSDYTNSIRSAGRALKELKRKMESDDRYIYLSFCFFVFTAAWIFMKRIGLVRLIHWLISNGFYGAQYLSDVSGIAPMSQSNFSATTDVVVLVPPLNASGTQKIPDSATEPSSEL